MAEGKAMLDQCSSWFKPSAWFYFRGRETSPAPLLTYPQTGINRKDFSCPGAGAFVCSETGKYRLFLHWDRGFLSLGPWGNHREPFRGQINPPDDRSPLQKPGKWRNIRLIPDDIENSYDNHIGNQNLLTKFAALFFFEMLIFSVFHAPEPKV